MDMEGKVALVTGGGRGIGRATVLSLARDGADIFLTFNRDEQAAREVCAAVQKDGRRCEMLRYEAEDEQAGDELVASVCQAFGRVDVLVNNCGVYTPKPLLLLCSEDVRHTFEVNFFAPFRLLQKVAACMVAKQVAGSIVNVLSVTHNRPRPGIIHYAASKSAAATLTTGAAVELAPYKIRVNAVAPGLITTDMNAFMRAGSGKPWDAAVKQIPLGRPGSVEEVAEAITFFASDRSLFATGSIFVVDGGRTIS